jgi:hypothetical protein
MIFMYDHSSIQVVGAGQIGLQQQLVDMGIFASGRQTLE